MRKYLKLYYQLQESFPELVGLCWVFDTYPKNEGESNVTEWEWYDRADPYFKLFYPSPQEYSKMEFYWGGDRGEFTDIRQNIVLLMAAMNGEL